MENEYANEADAEYINEKINDIYDLFVEEFQGDENRALETLEQVKEFIFSNIALPNNFPGNAVNNVTDLKKQIEDYPDFINTAEEIFNDFIEEIRGQVGGRRKKRSKSRKTQKKRGRKTQKKRGRKTKKKPGHKSGRKH